MPITEKCSIYYSMQHNIKKQMDYKFCETFMKELHNVWGFSLNDFNWESIGYCEGTGGWYESFAATCRILNKGELLLYYNNLSWYDSDLFDAELSELLVTYKLILPTVETDEMARQLDIDEDNIKHCFYLHVVFNVYVIYLSPYVTIISPDFLSVNTKVTNLSLLL